MFNYAETVLNLSQNRNPHRTVTQSVAEFTQETQS